MTSFIILLIAVAIGLYFLYRYLRNVQPNSTELNEDLTELRQQIVSFKGGCIALTQDELSLMSLKAAGTSKRENSGVVMGSGHYLTTASEPVLAYAFQKYLAQGQHFLLLVYSYQGEYVFTGSNNGTEIKLNGKTIGKIRKNTNLHDLANKPIAALNDVTDGGYCTVSYGSEVIGLLPPAGQLTLKQLPNTDAYHLNRLPSTQLEAFYSLCAWHLAYNAMINE